MTIRSILLYPDPRLRLISSPIEDFQSSSFKQILDDLNDTLNDAPACVGIAAPQIAEFKRIILVDLSRSKKTIENQGRMLLINPVILEHSGNITAREGCLSLPHLTANVNRAKNITIKAQDSNANQIIISACDFEARVILHELDHLDGLLFLDRVSSLKTDIFRRKKY